MAIPTAPQLTLDSDYGSETDIAAPGTPSEYGSDFDGDEETLIENLLTQIASPPPPPDGTVLSSIEEYAAAAESVQQQPCSPTATAVVRLAKGVSVEVESPQHKLFERSASLEVEYHRYSREFWSIPRDLPGSQKQRFALEVDKEPERKEDTRTPLERFRTKPKKPLSVTDLVSPAWCEVQYWFNLTKYGRKPQTKAMKEGSKVHKALEEQVHDIIQVHVKSKEDRFGLKIWNTIQGLRTLRMTGITRELEVWGVLDGQVVNGILDEISYTCPDPDFEATLESAKIKNAGGTLPLGQLTIAQSFANNASASWLGSLEPERVVYISDTKTRSAKSVPAGASLRPTWMQLMIYRKLLQSLALNTVDAETVFSRYGLKSLEPFTEVFIEQVDDLDNRAVPPAQDENPYSALQASELEMHNNLLALWSLMITEFSQTINSISEVLCAEFRYNKTGEVIGSEVFAYQDNDLEQYLSSAMSWWRGKREAKGVEIEEAFKCRTCDFADDCSWRKNKVEEAKEKARLRAAGRAKAAV